MYIGLDVYLADILVAYYIYLGILQYKYQFLVVKYS